ncbi:MAG: HAD-IC family P-type ATPase, partial [Armatimonadota bacterium]|nr:HAD-IC family P-type ATPase [Armatimonadota bacterium]
TGTLTRGDPEVLEVVTLGGRSPAELLALAAAVEARSEHPLAQAVLRRAYAQSVRWPVVEEFEALPGMGARATIGEQTYYIGRPGLFEGLGVSLDGARDRIEKEQAAGRTVLLLGTQEGVEGLVVVADRPRSAARDAIAALKRLGVERIVMLTGDHAGTAAAVAREVGVDEVHAGLLPQQKVAVVQDLLKRYGRVAMVGDGVNDAPALAAATVGVAMGAAGTDVALETADVALMADDLSRLPFVVDLGRRVVRVIRQNIVVSLVVKLVFVLMAFTGHATLWMAVLADMGTSLLVTANGLRLLRFGRGARRKPHSHAHPAAVSHTPGG